MVESSLKQKLVPSLKMQPVAPLQGVLIGSFESMPTFKPEELAAS
jgi:hypothetical protein